MRVKGRRTDLGLTQEQLAEHAGLHWTYIGQIERGQRNLTLVNILKVAGALGCNAAELVRDLDLGR